MSIRYVDEAEKPIPPANTWNTLSAIQLGDVRTQLQEKLWHFRNQPQIAIVLRQSIERLDGLIVKALTPEH